MEKIPDTFLQVRNFAPRVARLQAGLALADGLPPVVKWRSFHSKVAMGKIESIEQQIKALSAEELARFRAWFLEYDWATWDRQLARDVRAGKLDALAEKALRDHAAGKTTRL